MTTQEYLTESAKLCEAMGKRPEWKQGKIGRYSLARTFPDGWSCYQPDNENIFQPGPSISDHEAACIFEHHWRVWLESRGCDVVRRPLPEGTWYEVYVDCAVVPVHMACGEILDDCDFTSLHEAQIAAVKHVMEEASE